MTEEQTFYDKVGGHETFVAIADKFYERLENEPLLLAMYPKKIWPELKSG